MLNLCFSHSRTLDIHWRKACKRLSFCSFWAKIKACKLCSLLPSPPTAPGQTSIPPARHGHAWEGYSEPCITTKREQYVICYMATSEKDMSVKVFVKVLKVVVRSVTFISVPCLLFCMWGPNKVVFFLFKFPTKKWCLLTKRTCSRERPFRC